MRILFIVALISTVLSCGAEQPEASLCGAGDQTPLLDVVLTGWTPSADFTVSPHTNVWIGLTRLPLTYGGLSAIGPVADLHPIHAGATPAIVTDSNGNKNSTDPIIELQNDQRFREASISSGTWQIYSNTDPGIRIVSCPGTG